MKIQCPSPTCDHSLIGLKSAMGQRVSCPQCDHSFIWTDRFYSGETFIIYDLETTGLSPDYDEFIQIAAVKFSSGCLCPTDSFSSFAKPRHRISSFIESYTGIGDRDVRNSPRPEQVLCDFAAWSDDGTLIAHNAKRFDSKFLQATCQRHGLPSREVDAIDSIGISKMLFGKTRGTGHSLRNMNGVTSQHSTNVAFLPASFEPCDPWPCAFQNGVSRR
jgi:DNA polymerase III alpha subunit (gram-positive type)